MFDTSTVLGPEEPKGDRMQWCYIHGKAESRYNMVGGYDVPHSWCTGGSVEPTEVGEYPCTFHFPGGVTEPGTLVLWLDHTFNTPKVRGYFVLSDDKQGMGDARRCAVKGREGR